MKGDWKVGGLGFGIYYEQTAEQPYDYDPRLPRPLQQNLDFAAPEYILAGRIAPCNDLFALGCLVLSLFNGSSPYTVRLQCEQL